ncbi:MAG: hypothetical protein LBQ88_07715 [Treponema sp.]|jgi:hypothetical protein|nr:hypothetical protein [Treponema sp.]
MKNYGLWPCVAALILSVLFLITGCPTEGDTSPGESNKTTDPPQNETPPEPDGPLVGTTWTWTTMTLEFTTNTSAILGPDTLSYTYDETNRTGVLDAAGDFTVSEDQTALTFPDYKGYGRAVAFKGDVQTDPVLVDTKWRLGLALLNFTSRKQVTLGDASYTYTYDKSIQKGNIKTLGDFSITGTAPAQTLTFSNFKGYEFQAGFAEDQGQPAPTLNDTLMGTEWFWGSEWGATVIMFTSPTVVNGGQRAYTYEPATRKGTVIEVGPFTISKDGQHMSFAQWRTYPHGAEFLRRDTY